MPHDQDTNDRFGVPDQLIIDVIKAHRGIIRDGCYVPTRHEVSTLEPSRLAWILLGWWWESPSELIPTDEQVAASVEILRQRPDAGSPPVRDLIAQAPPPAGTDSDDQNDQGRREFKSIDQLEISDRRRLTGTALRGFWRLARRWCLTDDEQLILLGISSKSTLLRWRKGKVIALRRDTFERLSLLFRIFRALHQLFGGARADEWIRLPNKARLFGGRSALDHMLGGSTKDLYDTCDYLDGVLNGWLG